MPVGCSVSTHTATDSWFSALTVATAESWLLSMPPSPLSSGPLNSARTCSPGVSWPLLVSIDMSFVRAPRLVDSGMRALSALSFTGAVVPGGSAFAAAVATEVC